MVDVQQLAARHVEAHREELAAAIDRELERLLTELVNERLTNGNGTANGNGATSVAGGHQTAADATAAPTVTPELPEPAAKLCRRWGEPGTFDVGRRVCRRCRLRQERERQAHGVAVNGAGDDPPG